MTHEDRGRPLEAGIHQDLSRDLSYNGYLGLDQILNAQQPLSDPPHHDEMLFIIQHQTAELWFKLVIHELGAATRALAADDPGPCEKNLARVRQIQQQLFNQWGVLETLTPSEYSQFRNVLGRASGFQSQQYRMVEFMLGNKNPDMLKVFKRDPQASAALENALAAPSLYDELLAFLARQGHQVPDSVLRRDYAQPHQHQPELVDMFVNIYRHPDRYWTEYALAERFVDVEESFQLWRFRHLRTVERIIGFSQGTGGSSGVPFLRKALEFTFFPEIFAVRTELMKATTPPAV
ncbi:MAG: tryptophan 2,3-dioxygenase family protein [Wenzhouxiangellaceae bacterium]